MVMVELADGGSNSILHFKMKLSKTEMGLWQNAVNVQVRVVSLLT
jgi:hypothetical protein